MSFIIINGKPYVGSNVSVQNGKVIVDGKDVTPDIDSKEIIVTVDGNIQELNVDSCNKVTVNGNVVNLKTISGDVDVSGNVSGPIKTISGDVDCGNVGGSINTTSGDIKYKRS